MRPSLNVLYEDNHLLVVNKPAGIPTMGAAEDEASLWRLARDYVKVKYRKPGNVYLGVVSRLDALVTGVVVFARTSKAAARLAAQFRTRAVEKTYWAIVERPPKPPAGRCEDQLEKDEQLQRMVVVRGGESRGLHAALQYRTLSSSEAGVLLEIVLETGRKHQIRIQLADRGWPILGDRKYGARRAFGRGIALHARKLVLQHPTRGDELTFTAPPPAEWGDLARSPPGD